VDPKVGDLRARGLVARHRARYPGAGGITLGYGLRRASAALEPRRGSRGVSVHAL